ncbi:39168_t:CDS:2 [Gigaspora margarita]|uniref:39168_t:CDS:1 n=1 Tax=Gigaspora margarita TaxID=4874 RepID=A0ABM8VZG1_GIGMA|nr:39168_t:CDS:2 [Gigaspora margarita]
MRKVAELNLVNEERIKLINDLEAQIGELTCDIERLRDNFKMAAAESSQNAIKMNDAMTKRDYEERKFKSSVALHKHELKRRDEREFDLNSQITLLRNRIQELESLLDEREINLSLLRNRIQTLKSSTL